MLKPWIFGKPRGPGFSISSAYYLSVLAPTAILPSIAQIVKPKPSGEEVAGFGVPLGKGIDPSAIDLPMARGVYGIASPDRKTVLKLLVLNRDETPFDPEAVAKSELALDLSPELIARIRGTWFMLQFAFESYDPAVYPAVRFLLQIVKRTGVLCDGAVADPVSQRYDLPENYLLHGTTDFAIDVRDVVSIRHRMTPLGWHFFTFGLQKFDLPEVEVQGCQSFDQPAAGALLLGMGQQMLNGIKVEPGGAAGAKSSPFRIRIGGLDRSHWEGISVLELIPQATQTSSESLAIWLQEQSN